ncbi:unnamed protein product [Candidula unifasciata]|uniref:Uncharacterized protein n=1 Tax=Candidula unifasciata TaxID=100452 RepID=A0A8S3YQS3_9EUPU|nr:unnamed protein product [Candidula unifasciata]
MANKEEKQRDDEVERLCLLFTGRINKNLAQQIIEESGGLQEAACFLMLSSSEIVRQRLRKNAEYVRDLQRDAAKFRETLDSGTEDMQFACEACNRMWWKRVPKRKQVSKCYRCRIKYEPIPPEHQWGWGEFECPVGHTFRGFGIMGRTKSKCYRCDMKKEAELMFIIPPKKRDEEDAQRPRRHRHNCNGINCYHPTGDYKLGDNEKPPVCIHPRSHATNEPVRIHCASNVHISTGSTFVTILDQGSLDTNERKPADSLKTISEHSDEEADNV